MMVNYKPKVFQALRDITTWVSDEYPMGDSWDYPVIVYADEDNSPETYTPEGERITRLRFRVEIHAGHTPTTALMQEVEDRMLGLGFRRTHNYELADPEGRKMRIMRYEGLYDHKTERLYFHQ